MPSSNKQCQTLIIGGGVIGLSIAWELSKRGENVCVLEAEQFGRGASWAGAGILPPSPNRGAIDPFEQLKALSHQLHGKWAESLKAETGIDTGFRRCGGVYLARSLAEAATLAANRLWWDEHGIDYEAWDATCLIRHEPSLRDFANRGLKSAWYLPDECQLRNPRHLKALIAACTRQGVELIANAAVQHPLIENGRIVGVNVAEQRISADRVCICSGAWARQILDDLKLETGIMPVRGQMLLYACATPPLSRIVNEGNRYLVPREDGRLLAGSVEEEVGYVVETTDEALGQIRTWATSVLPGLQDCEIERTWAGLRPGSYDGLPYMGPVPGVQNLFVAAGHYRSGLHLSCATAVVMADTMLGRTPPVDLRAFRVGR